MSRSSRTRKIFISMSVICSLVLLSLVFTGSAFATTGDAEVDAAIQKWVKVFQPSVLTEEEQIAEFEWFVKAAKSFKGMEVKSVAEGIKTHKYEANVIAKAFREITGINLTHDIIGEGEIVDRVQRQIQTGVKLYDIYVNDADLIGTHLRLDSALNWTEYMVGEGKDVTNPGLDLNDWLNPEYG